MVGLKISVDLISDDIEQIVIEQAVNSACMINLLASLICRLRGFHYQNAVLAL